ADARERGRRRRLVRRTLLPRAAPSRAPVAAVHDRESTGVGAMNTDVRIGAELAGYRVEPLLGRRGMGGVGHFPKYVAEYKRVFPRIAAGIAENPFPLEYYGSIDRDAGRSRGHTRRAFGPRAPAPRRARRVDLHVPNGHFTLDSRHQAGGTNLILATTWPKL